MSRTEQARKHAEDQVRVLRVKLDGELDRLIASADALKGDVQYQRPDAALAAQAYALAEDALRLLAHVAELDRNRSVLLTLTHTDKEA